MTHGVVGGFEFVLPPYARADNEKIVVGGVGVFEAIECEEKVGEILAAEDGADKDEIGFAVRVLGLDGCDGVGWKWVIVGAGAIVDDADFGEGDIVGGGDVLFGELGYGYDVGGFASEEGEEVGHVALMRRSEVVWEVCKVDVVNNVDGRDGRVEWDVAVGREEEVDVVSA